MVSKSTIKRLKELQEAAISSEPYQTYHERERYWVKFLKDNHDLRITIEDSWRPHQIKRIRELLARISASREFKKPANSKVGIELTSLLSIGPPTDKLPDDVDDLDLLLSLVQKRRSRRSQRLILHMVLQEWQETLTLTSQAREDTELLELTRGLELDSFLMKQMNSQPQELKYDLPSIED